MTHSPRTFVPQDSRSRHKATTITPRDYVASTLIAQLADGWLTYSRNTGSAESTIINRASMIRRLGRFLSDPNDAELSLDGADSRLPQRLLDWERAVIAQEGTKSTRASTCSKQLRAYAAAFLADQGINDPIAWRWANGRALQYRDGADRRNPLDEFSNQERITIEKAFRQVVGDGETLLEIGNRLLSEGQDPRKAGWDAPSNLVWGLHNLAPSEIPRELPTLGVSDKWWDELVRIAPDARRLRGRFVGNPAIGLAIPSLLHLQAIRCLILLRTGWPPEELLHATNSGIEFGESHVRLATEKRRASKTRYRELAVTNPESKLGWSPGDLLRRAEASTAMVKSLVPDRDEFWVGALTRSRPAHYESDMSKWISTLASSRQYNFGMLLKQTGVTVSAPFDIRRLRKTNKSAKAALLGTLAGSTGDDHTVEVFSGHYAQSTTVHTLAAQTVLNAQKYVMGKVGPTVIAVSAKDTASLPVEGPVGRVAQTVASESPLDQSLSVTGCVDPNNPPHAKTSHCTDGPQHCLNCSNALVFSEHVPRLVAYRRILKELEPEMAPQQFAATYGQQIVNIDAILEKFPSDLVETAERSPTAVRVPLTMRKGR